MILSANRFLPLALALLIVGVAGCQTSQRTAAVANGFEEVAHPTYVLMDEPPPPRISLQHRDRTGHVIPIWPDLYSETEIIKGDLAIFVGSKAYVEPAKVTHPRLFAVKPPAPPLDLTDEILWRWSKANGKDFARTLEKFDRITPGETNGGVALQLEFYSNDKDWPDEGTVQLSWPQVSELMATVKKKGVLQKDLRWHTPYVGEKF